MLIWTGILCMAAEALLFAGLYYKKRKTDKKIEGLAEEINHFLLYPDFTEDSVEEGRFGNLLQEVRGLEKQFLYQKQCEGQREKEVTEFVENMAHQMKTAATALQLRLDLAQLQSVSQEEKEALLKSQICMERLIHEIDWILKSSQLASGKILMSMEELNLSELVVQCAGQLEALAEKKGVVLWVEKTDAVFLSGDSFWLWQAVENLLKNAIEHTVENSKIQIRIREEGINAVILIKDQGNGIPPEELQKIFRRFYRGSLSGAGYGIGLSMAQDIVAAHHGKLTAGNGRTAGAWFCMSIPLLDGSRAYPTGKSDP